MEVKSPGGFVFGIVGYEYGEVRPKSLTFFVDGTARVYDHRGNKMLVGSHVEVVEKLAEDGIDWQKLDWAGWPQLTYELLKELIRVPDTTLEDLGKITDKGLRAASIKFRIETDEALIAANKN